MHDAPAVTAEDMDRTSTIVTAALWSIAAVAMLGSATNSWVTFGNLHATSWHGVITALTVDVSLAVWLRMKKRLQDADVTSRWGHVHEWVTGGMTAYLNAGAALFLGLSKVDAKLPLTTAYCFVPATLILSCLTFGDALTRLRQARRERDAAERNARDAEVQRRQADLDAQRREQLDLDRRRADGELVTAQDIHAEASRLRNEAARLKQTAEQDQQAAARVRAEIEAEVTATEAAKAKLAERPPSNPVVAKPATTRRKGKTATPEQRRQWVRDEIAAGRHPTPADVNKQFGPPDNGWRIVGDVKRELRAEVEKQRGLQLVENT